MDSLFTKPYAFSIAVTLLGLSFACFLRTDNLYIVGILLSFSSFFIFYSFTQSNLKMFKLGRLFTYIGAGCFYVEIAIRGPLLFQVFFLTAMAIWHMTLEQIIKEEYEDYQ